MVKLGVVLSLRNHPDYPYSLADLYSDYIEDGVRADSLGFDHLWINEHHFSPDNLCPSTMVTLAAIASRTKRIRLGTGVVNVPFHDPLRLAEDAAVLDIISRGRVDLGIGIGSSLVEYRTFNTRREEAWRRTWEAADFIERVMKNERVDFAGEYYRYEDVWQNTRPVQPSLPIWWGGFGRNSMKRAAERSYHVLAAASDVYDETLINLGKSIDDHEVAQITAVHVAETREQAWDEAQYGAHWYMNFHRTRNNWPAGYTSSGPLETLPAPERLRNVDGLLFMPGMPIYIGTPDFVREELLADIKGRGGRISQLALHFRLPGMRTPEVERSMELFRAEIMPHLQ
ncbi:LLM class flavin-dependent oxidoreductase [Nocardia sp. NPDC050408]|uniref:LLM class flavin-dependent oxidoreductase n=1 Tax=Nocardia sp. NPDC050408 TaxID=3364319 RepID=UPI00379861E5